MFLPLQNCPRPSSVQANYPNRKPTVKNSPRCAIGFADPKSLVAVSGSLAGEVWGVRCAVNLEVEKDPVKQRDLSDDANRKLDRCHRLACSPSGSSTFGSLAPNEAGFFLFRWIERRSIWIE
jgi:hypothetical protein